MRSLRACVLSTAVVVALGCSQSTSGPATAGCDCRLEGTGLEATLVMSWDCYCSAYGDGCMGKFVAGGSCFGERFDYPGCGLTVVRGMPAGGPTESVHDANGNLVGARIASDTGPYACPSDPTLTALRARSGQFPAATCAEVACGACSASSCAGADGATP